MNINMDKTLKNHSLIKLENKIQQRCLIHPIKMKSKICSIIKLKHSKFIIKDISKF